MKKIENSLILKTGISTLSIKASYDNLCKGAADRLKWMVAAGQLIKLTEIRIFAQKFEWLRTLLTDVNTNLLTLILGKDKEYNLYWVQLCLLLDNDKLVNLNKANGHTLTEVLM